MPDNLQQNCNKKIPEQIVPGFFLTADDRIRTDDLRITNALLYQLSHIGEPLNYYT
jgi:hypothetical protein